MDIKLDEMQAREILKLAGLHTQPSVTPVKKHNHVFRLDAEGEIFYLKAYTKDWYKPLDTGVVRHESAGFQALSRRGVPAVEVVLSRPDCENPLRRPFLLTRSLKGQPLTDLLGKASATEFQAMLRSVGAYLKRCQEIVFRFPGYLMDPEGPQAPPVPGEWIHFYCSASQMQTTCLEWLNKKRPRLPHDLAQTLQDRYSTMQTTLACEFEPPRFIQGDCHAHQIYLFREADGWKVTGAIDMEVAAAGAPLCDLLKFSSEMVERFPSETHWWEYLFEGYGSAPDFERLKLIVLGDSAGEPAARLQHLLAAQDWKALFSPSPK